LFAVIVTVAADTLSGAILLIEPRTCMVAFLEVPAGHVSPEKLSETSTALTNTVFSSIPQSDINREPLITGSNLA
jgi:hypothetical protein